ncbi:SLC13 family permease [Magnetospirillum sulfuroxidans]|uniref:Anion transporter n=1 Tax=Magnetospirillum sulfuroxidans TaxID=611300 RepID=A0ABS5IBP5_9PROT|nr:SLC13 family permease [Magnetospirillum sulfuroxidans]MBR9971734.1 anion transporter [Magnetospirillum sulfuroxidans]
MDNLIVIVFGLTYLGMALGRVPGLTLDRTGIALIGAVALLASGRVGVGDAGAAIDMPTLLLLFALMLISAQFQEAGLYRVVAGKVAVSAGSANRLLLLTILAAGLLAAILANDIVVFAMAPMLIEGIKGRGMDPRPFLLGLAGGANAGSAITIIGNPQNILIGQVGDLDFWQFIAACGVPALVSMLLVFWCVRLFWRRELAVPPVPAAEGLVPRLDYWQTAKGVAAVGALLALFATDLPREVGALAVAAPLLLSRRLASRDMIGTVDWHLLLLFACLFVVTDAFAATNWAASGVEWLAERQWLPDRIGVMAPMLTLASNTIGNVPAVMLILSMWPIEGSGPLYGLALLSTLAGNLLLVGSLANIIVAERAAASGVRLGFLDFAKAGIPMTLASLAVAAAWLLLGGWMNW